MAMRGSRWAVGIEGVDWEVLRAEVGGGGGGV